MSLKIDFYFLFNSKKALVPIDAVLHDKNITFNEDCNGEYSYWLNGPIWTFGESKSVVLSVENNSVSSCQILRDILKYYSPMIKYGLFSNGHVFPVQLSAIEQENTEYVEIGISLDYGYLCEKNPSERAAACLYLTDLFHRIILIDGCYWGIAGIEIAGFDGIRPMGWRDLQPQHFFDLCFISKKAQEQTTLDLKSLESELTIKVLPDQSLFLQRVKDAFLLGDFK